MSFDEFLRLNKENSAGKCHNGYIEKLKHRTKQAYGITSKEAGKSSEQKKKQKNKKQYNRKITGSILDIKDRVLVRKVGVQRKCKLVDKREQEPDVVVNIPHSETPVLKVQRESRKRPIRTLHKNMLMSFNFMPPENTEQSENSSRYREEKSYTEILQIIQILLSQNRRQNSTQMRLR